MNRAKYFSKSGSFPGVLLLAVLSFGLPSARGDWPEFRGPRGDGHVSAPGDTKPVGLPLTWSESSNIKWKTEIPHRGWSTPVIMGGQVWLTTATVEGHDYFAICLDQETGKILFNEKVFHTDNPEPLGNGASMNCYATPSPVIELGRVYVHFGSAGTACLDTKTGKVLWQRNDLPCRHYRGASASPVVFENLLILTFDGADLQYTAALDKQTGKTVWKTDRSVVWNDESVPGPMARDGDLRKSHGTPLIATVNGKPQLISVGAKASYGYEPRTGKELWRVEYNDWSSAPRPLFENGLAYIVTGLRTKEMWAVKPDGQGNVTDTHVTWKLATHIGKYASPLLVDGLIYTPADESFVTCLEASTGKVVWTERIGGKYAASPIYADGRLFFPSQEGVMTVLKPGRTFEALATNTLAAGFMASPAVDGKALYLRTRTHLYRVESGATAAKTATLKVIKVNSEETIGENTRGTNAVDGNPATIWHTEWDADTDSLSSSHEIVIELNPPTRIKGFTYLPRQDGQENGMIKRYEFYVSDDGQDFGSSVAKGEFARGKDLKSVTFDAKPGRYVKLRARSEINGQVWASAAEIGVISE